MVSDAEYWEGKLLAARWNAGRMEQATNWFLCRWELANGLRRAHGLPDMLYGEARASIPRDY